MSKAVVTNTGDISRFALCIEYNGSAYKGWQAQKSPKVATVQESLEKALSVVADHPVKLVCAGRTDSGVHASAQIAHFDSASKRPEKAWVKGANSLLEGNICVQWAKLVEENFHARFSAQSRHYRYVIYNNPVKPAIMKGLVTSYYYPLNEVHMNEGAQYLLGEQDFTSYRGVACQSKTAMRNVSSVSVTRQGQFLVIDIQANAFLLHMVRNIVGVLLEVGEGKREPIWVKEVLEYKDRSQAGITARPDGLYLVNVSYPEIYNLPSVSSGPAWLWAGMPSS